MSVTAAFKKTKRKKMTSPYIKIRQSRIHGKGAFAIRDIPNGAKIIEYVGEKLTKAQSQHRAEIPLENHRKNKDNGAVYLFELNKRYDIDGFVDFNTARFINHSCEPSAETDIIGGRIWIMATRDIKKGEEVTYNYGYSYEDYKDHPCRCGKPACIGYILHEEAWPVLKRVRTRKRNQMKLKRAQQKKASISGRRKPSKFRG